jgi:hypothetical protein
MTKKIYEEIGEKLHVAAKKPRKSRAKRVVGKLPELAMPYGTVYKTPGICSATRDVLLGSASGYTVALMSTYNQAFVEQQAERKAERLLRMLDHKTAPVSFDPPPRLNLRP